jgi:hypothetical protein
MFPWKYFVFRKQERSKEIKIELFTLGEVLKCIQLRFGNTHEPLGHLFSAHTLNPKTLNPTRYQVWYIVLSLVSTLAWTGDVSLGVYI